MRFLREAHRRFGRFPILCAGVGLLGTAHAGEEGPGPLPWRVAGRVGFTVDAAAFPDSSGYILEVYVRVTPATIVDLSRDQEGKARLRLTARLRSSFGASQRTASQEFETGPADTARGLGEVVLLRFPTRPGVQRLQVKLEDLRSRKRGLAYIGRNVTESGAVEGEFEVPGPQEGRDLSDLEFAWSEEAPQPGSPFERSGRRVLPNPERLYGLMQTQLRVFFSGRGLSGDERPWHWVARVLNADHAVVAEEESTGSAKRWLEAGFTADLSRAPSGGYDLEVKAWQEGDPGALLRRAHFGVAWRPQSWLRNPRDIEDNVHFLLTAEQEEKFARLNPGEQERFLDDFWLRRDPSPETAENEALDEFLRRVAIANRAYANVGLGRGMFTDMGRVFIRYGEPNEVLHQVIPAGDNTLLQALRVLQITEDRPVGDVHQKGPGGDMRPFEVWIYEGDIPPPPDSDPQLTRITGRRRLVFLFVDEQGNGEFLLRYSTE